MKLAMKVHTDRFMATVPKAACEQVRRALPKNRTSLEVFDTLPAADEAPDSEVVLELKDTLDWHPK